MPLPAECTPYGREGDAESTRTGDCSWARHATQHFAFGADLLNLGFNNSRHAQRSIPMIQRNERIARRVFAQHAERCCGC